MGTLPQRKKLPHDVPDWVADGSVFYITICTRPRHRNQLCVPSSGKPVLAAAAAYHDLQKWYAHLFLLMPDHVHALLSFPGEAVMRRTMASWKGFVAKSVGIEWQRDFFDHRLRGNENHREKAHYIRRNPVRAGLVAKPEDWPYVWEPQDLG